MSSSVFGLLVFLRYLMDAEWVADKSKIVLSKIKELIKKEESMNIIDENQIKIKGYLNQLINEAINSLPGDRIKIEEIVDELCISTHGFGADPTWSDAELLTNLRFGLRNKFLNQFEINDHELEICTLCGDLLDFKSDKNSCACQS